jgi:hypothetical protein
MLLCFLANMTVCIASAFAFLPMRMSFLCDSFIISVFVWVSACSVPLVQATTVAKTNTNKERMIMAREDVNWTKSSAPFDEFFS